MKKNFKNYAILIIAVLAIIITVTGPILITIAAIQKFGWIALFVNKKVLTGLFGIITMWSIKLYRIGFIMSIIGTFTCITIKTFANEN